MLFLQIRKTPEKLEDIYKEPTVRKKAEKRALPGWSCEECKNVCFICYSINKGKIISVPVCFSPKLLAGPIRMPFGGTLEG